MPLAKKHSWDKCFKSEKRRCFLKRSMSTFIRSIPLSSKYTLKVLMESYSNMFIGTLLIIIKYGYRSFHYVLVCYWLLILGKIGFFAHNLLVVFVDTSINQGIGLFIRTYLHNATTTANASMLCYSNIFVLLRPCYGWMFSSEKNASPFSKKLCYFVKVKKNYYFC